MAVSAMGNIFRDGPRARGRNGGQVTFKGKLLTVRKLDVLLVKSGKVSTEQHYGDILLAQNRQDPAAIERLRGREIKQIRDLLTEEVSRQEDVGQQVLLVVRHLRSRFPGDMVEQGRELRSFVDNIPQESSLNKLDLVGLVTEMVSTKLSEQVRFTARFLDPEGTQDMRETYSQILSCLLIEPSLSMDTVITFALTLGALFPNLEDLGIAISNTVNQLSRELAQRMMIILNFVKYLPLEAKAKALVYAVAIEKSGVGEFPNLEWKGVKFIGYKDRSKAATDFVTLVPAIRTQVSRGFNRGDLQRILQERGEVETYPHAGILYVLMHQSFFGSESFIPLISNYVTMLGEVEEQTGFLRRVAEITDLSEVRGAEQDLLLARTRLAIFILSFSYAEDFYRFGVGAGEVLRCNYPDTSQRLEAFLSILDLAKKDNQQQALFQMGSLAALDVTVGDILAMLPEEEGGAILAALGSRGGDRDANVIAVIKAGNLNLRSQQRILEQIAFVLYGDDRGSKEAFLARANGGLKLEGTIAPAKKIYRTVVQPQREQVRPQSLLDTVENTKLPLLPRLTASLEALREGKDYTSLIFSGEEEIQEAVTFFANMRMAKVTGTGRYDMTELLKVLRDSIRIFERSDNKRSLEIYHCLHAAARYGIT